MTVSMVERVAKALVEANRLRVGTGDSDVNAIRLHAMQSARAAIAAMREPTDEMVIALTWPKIWPAHPAWAEAKAEWAQAIGRCPFGTNPPLIRLRPTTMEEHDGRQIDDDHQA